MVVRNDIEADLGRAEDSMRAVHSLRRPYVGSARIPALRLLNEATGPDQTRMAQWFHERDFHTAYFHACANGRCIVTARKRIRMLRDVDIETFTNLQVPGTDPHQLASMVPPGL
jgi:hypothetical protein